MSNNWVIFRDISNLDSIKQEKLFLIQKYIDLLFSKDFLERFWYDLNQIKNNNIFDLFNLIDQNEKEFKKIIFIYFIQNKKFIFNWKDFSFEELKEKSIHKSKLQIISKEFEYYFNDILSDVIKFNNLKNKEENLKQKEIQINWKNIKLENISNHYSKMILHILKRQKNYEKNKWNNYYDVNISQDTMELFWIEQEDLYEENNDIKNNVWKYDFFKKVFKVAQKWYILTRNDLFLIEDLLKDLQNNKVVLLTWDTWSWKTKLARFLCSEFLETQHVFISWSKWLEDSDFTLEKNIDSLWLFWNEDKIVTWENKNFTYDEKLKNEAKRFLDYLKKTQEFISLINQDWAFQKEEIEKIDFMSKNLITEYHLMWIIKAAKLWVPCIIDEVNLIRPEVFMALNDLLTKKIGSKIQLPNALSDVEVKKWFCIILTWNDPDQNLKWWKYKSWRYNFDEASYNRLRVYAKNYFNQTLQTHNENKIDELDKTYEYLFDNELYSVLLMNIFISNNSWDLLKTWKYWFEITKKDFDWEYIDKKLFFDSIKNFAMWISTIQKAFAWDLLWEIKIPELASKSLKDMIKRKVFSMRNLEDVIWAYKKSTLSLDYFIYEEFIKHTTNIEEKFALLTIFKYFWFFWNLVTDNMEKSIDNIERKIYLERKNVWTLTLDDIEKKFIITKQDMYNEYFWSFDMPDDYFIKYINIEEIQNEAGVWNDIDSLWGNIEINPDVIIDWIDDIINSLNNINLEEIDVLFIYNIIEILEKLKEVIFDYDNEAIKNIFSIIIDINNWLENFKNKNISETELILSLKKLYENQ